MKVVLIIDDERMIRLLLRHMLEREGYFVLEAANGLEGLKLYRQQPVDLIITDIIMPEKEGLETIMEMHADAPQIPIIAISGGGRVDPQNYLKLARTLGASEVFSKPFDRRDILRAVRNLTDGP